jgi:hypothetical protein
MMRSLAGLLIVALFAGVFYKYYWSNLQLAGAATPAQVLDIVGVKNDLVGIAMAERTYSAEHGTYASLDELISSDQLIMKSTTHNGYTYSVETGDQTFRAIAHCPATTNPGCIDLMIDESMEVQAAFGSSDSHESAPASSDSHESVPDTSDSHESVPGISGAH